MINKLPVYIGLRYIRSKRKDGFVAFISLFALFGMALGVFALIVVLSVMNGFDEELKSRILRVIPHGYVTSKQPLEDWQALENRISDTRHLLASAPFIEGRGLASNANRTKGIELQGVLPSEEINVSEVANYMVAGSFSDIKQGTYGIILGSYVARGLGVSLGDKVSVTLPVVSVTPAGVFPRSKRFTVVGIFEVGAQVDQSLALIHLSDAQKLFRLPDQVQGLRLRVDDIYVAPQLIQSLLMNLGDDYSGKDWSQTQGSLFSAVKMEKTVVGLLLGIIVAVAAFNIVTSLIMMVAEKRSNIAVLRTLGMTRKDIVLIFMAQGSTMGLIGVCFGALLGVAGANYLPSIVAWCESFFGFQVFDSNVYFVTTLPSVWHWQDTALICVSSLLLSFLATIYPSYRASLVAPAEALRYDI